MAIYPMHVSAAVINRKYEKKRASEKNTLDLLKGRPDAILNRGPSTTTESQNTMILSLA